MPVHSSFAATSTHRQSQWHTKTGPVARQCARPLTVVNAHRYNGPMNPRFGPAVTLLILLILGCAESAAPVDATPFREAIDAYLRANDMALSIKAIKTGPTIEGDTAELSASLVHQELAGPSVTWTFQFRRPPDGGWTVTSHE